MKVLLAKPVGGRIRNFSIGPDLGLGSLASALRERGHEVSLLDCMLEKMDDADFEAYLRRSDWDAVGFKFFSMNFRPIQRQLAAVKRLLPRAITLVGGAHPSAMPHEVLDQLADADFAFRGEAEVGLVELIAACEASGGAAAEPADLRPVQGLVWRRDGETVVNEQWLVPELDELPPPAWDLMQIPRYLRFPTGRNPHYIPIITSRGCPYPCSYCSAATMNGKPIRYRDPRRVVDEMVFLQSEYGVEFITISDDNFTMQPEHVNAICDELLARDTGLTWGTQQNGIRLDTVTPELLRKMEAAGCRALTVAVESGSERVLADMQKGFSLDEVRAKVALIKRETNLTLGGFFILGYPTETREDLERTLRFSRSLPLDSVNYNLFSPLPGTEITERLLKSGRLAAIDWSTQNLDLVSLPLADVSVAQLKRIYNWAWIRFYLQPRVVLRLLSSGLKRPGSLLNFLKSLRHVIFKTT